jgi:hypothetical protein
VIQLWQDNLSKKSSAKNQRRDCLNLWIHVSIQFVFFKEKAVCFHYKDHFIDTIHEKIAVYSHNNMKLTNILCGQNAELLNVKAGGRYGYHSLCLIGLTGATRQFVSEAGYKAML